MLTCMQRLVVATGRLTPSSAICVSGFERRHPAQLVLTELARVLRPRNCLYLQDS